MKYKTKFFAGVVLPTMLAVSSLEGCGGSVLNTHELVKITALNDSYKQFGVSSKILKRLNEIDSIRKQGNEKISNKIIVVDLMPSRDFEGNVEKGKIGEAGYWELTEKIANAINRKYRKDNGIELNGEGEENAPKVVEASDISIEVIDEENKIYGIYVKGKLLFSNKLDSNNPIDKEILNYIQSYFDFIAIDVSYSDLNRVVIFKSIDGYIAIIEEVLEYEFEYAEDGSLKKGKRVDRYFFGQDESKNYGRGDE